MKNDTNLWARRLGLAALGLTMTLAACSDSAVAPELGGMNDFSVRPMSDMTTSTGENVLKWAEAFAETRTVTQKVGTWGGLLTIDGLITLTVPPGAVDETTELSMTTYAGEDVAFEFGPHGTQFNQPVSIWLDLCAVTGIGTVTPASSMQSINVVGSATSGKTDKSAGTSGSWKKDGRTDAVDGYQPDQDAPAPEAPQTGGSDADVPEDSGTEATEPEAGNTSSVCDGNWWEIWEWGNHSSSDKEDAPMLNVGDLVAVYFTDAGPMIETLDIIDVELVLNRYLKFDTDHFSGYALAW
ncbi:MAG: hypothetical protein ACR2QM_18175 [Longimicrobiales bacterium]